jgi:glycosyltransferase involved in cell wall biosynthesis
VQKNLELSAIVLTRNEEKNIKGCLKSLDFCDQIIIVDDYSEDQTLQIAKKFKPKVYQRRLQNNFAAQRNFGLSKAKSEWVLFLDADERVSPELASEIKQVINNPRTKGFLIKRTDFLWGKELRFGETNQVFLRLARRKGGKWQRKVHETWQIKGEAGRLKNSILHYPHQSIKDFIDSIDVFSSLHALANQKEAKQSSLFKIIFWPLAKFVINYIFKLGFLDGVRGFLLAVIMSSHSYLAWSKLWLSQNRKSSEA